MDSFLVGDISSRRQFAAILLSAPLVLAKTSEGKPLVFCCSGENDLYRLLSSAGARITRYATPAQAIARAPKGSGVLILADQYPETPVLFSDKMLSRALAKNLRVYVEYAVTTAASETTPQAAKWERAVVTSSFFGPSLSSQRILSLHECRYLALPLVGDGTVTHLVLARVAGFDTAVFGLPEKDVHPLLVEGHAGHVLKAATQLSRFVTARYGPVAAWTAVWQAILKWLLAAKQETGISWTPAVRPSWPASTVLPKDAERRSFTRGAKWYYNARLFIDSSWAHKLEEARGYPDQIAPAPSQKMRVGDGSLGLLEGHSSHICLDGSQPARWWIRSDCVGETAMVLSLAQKFNPHGADGSVARNLVDFLLLRSKMASGIRLDPANPSYGLLGWNETPKYFKNENGYDVYYGDDNARALMGILVTSALTGESRWGERFWMAILANFKLIGTLGHQQFRYDQAPLEEKGWRFYHDSPIVLHDMNYQAYPWALFLWAYAKTGYTPFFDRIDKGIRLTMEAYPDKWRWTNSITSQQARLLLPLAWLVRVKDTAEARSWLNRIAGDLLSHQNSTGAIQEWTGSRGTGLQMPPTSNQQYGTGEGTLTQQNGDPAADLLYTMNFAFIGLHEAFAATGERHYKAAADRIADFLVRAQVTSEAHPEFDGAWYRAFDFSAWDYWASNSDSGWGAWCTESGWSQSWISTTFSLRLLDTSLWDIAATLRGFSAFDQFRRRILTGQPS